MPHSIQPVVGKTYYTYDGKRFTINSVDSVDVVITDASGTRVIMSLKSWADLRLDIEKTNA